MEAVATFSPCNVSALDSPDPNAGNACHHYAIAYLGGPMPGCEIKFQHGPRGEPGSISGVFDDALLAVVQHRLEGFQSGEFACRENHIALTALKQARAALGGRVAKRMAQGVLGANKPHVEDVGASS